MGIRVVLKARWLAGTILVVVAVLVCLRLGWWQWDRTREADGTLQNLAYAILWPAFGGSFIYMWWRFVSLEQTRDLEDDREFDDDLVSLTAESAAAPDGQAGVGVGPDRNESETPGRRRGSRGRTELDPTDTDDVIEPTDDHDYFIGTVEEADDDVDPELAEYNRALAALAEEDRRRAG